MKWLIAFFCLVFLITSTAAYSAVSPSRYERDFESNFRESFAFKFIVSEGLKADISVEGDLAEYVRLDKNKITGEGVVVALVELPSKIDIPGDHILKIKATQTVESDGGVAVALAVAGNIKIKVPYPGKYVELDLKAEDKNAGEPINFNLTIYSKGDEDVFTSSHLEISDSSGFIERLNLEEAEIKSKQNKIFSKVLDTFDYGAGNYNVSAFVDYGGEKVAIASKIFRLGHLFVDVSNYTSEFEAKKINRFVIEAESFWNEKIEGLYAEVDVLGHREIFRTPSTNLDPWKKTTLTGFMDASEIEDEIIQANITLHYQGESSSKVVELKLKEETDYTFYVLIIGGIVVLIVILWLGLRFIKSKYKIVKNDKKK